MSLTSYRAAPSRDSWFVSQRVSVRAVGAGGCEWVLLGVCMRASMPGGDQLFHRLSDRTIGAAAAYLRAQAGVRVLAGLTLNDAGPTAGMRFLHFQTPWGMFMDLGQVPAHMPYEQSATGRLSGPAPAWNAGRPGMSAGEQEPARHGSTTPRPAFQDGLIADPAEPLPPSPRHGLDPGDRVVDRPDPAAAETRKQRHMGVQATGSRRR